MTYQEKIAALRTGMKNQQIDAYLIPSSDPHISEYLPERYKVIAWLSGFTGSAGTLLITADFAGLWTDSRYFVQATEQLRESGVSLMKLVVQNAPEYADWTAQNLREGAVLAFDGKLVSAQVAHIVQETVSPAGIQVKGNIDLFEEIWQQRPALPKEKAYLLNAAETGQSVPSKIQAIREKMKAFRADYHVISTLDDLAWALNIRGNDVNCNPVVLGFVLIGPDQVQLFINPEKLDPAAKETLASAGIATVDYDLIWNAIGSLPAGSRLLIDPRRNCHALYANIPASVTIVEKTNPSTDLKAIKNELEIALTRETMVKDGVALTRFFKWLEEEMAKGSQDLSEGSISDKLREFRAEQMDFVGESFDTIAGYREHGALPHYKITETSNSKLEARGLFLIDSGGQYRGGTTDITRVVSLGGITEEEKKDYTLVLKGMIEGSTTIFPKNSRGYQIDAITRKPLWDAYRNYGHGTGHGVGFFLNVHEGPHVFNAAPVDVPIQTGMITSIEPGLYLEGKYGIRIENLVLAIESEKNYFGEFMAFETLTLCYISTDLIDTRWLDEKHIQWVNDYHQMVYERLAPHLNEEEQNWLREKTAKI